MYPDCHGQPISPCTPIMSCGNFAEIIGNSLGVRFKNPDNAFAGLTISLRENSGLILDSTGLGINWAALCAYVSENCDGGPQPTNTSSTTPGPTATTSSTTPAPTGTNPTMTRTGIPFYDCRAADNTSVQNQNGTVSITWNTTTGTITYAPVFGASVGYLFSGSAGGANFVGLTSSNGFTLSQFNAITMVSKSDICGATTSSTTSSSSSSSTTSSSTTPAPVLTKTVQVANGNGCGYHSATVVFDPGTGSVTITEDRTYWAGTSTSWQGYTNLNGGSPTGPMGSPLSALSSSVLQGAGFTQGMFDNIVTFRGTDDCTGTGG